MKNFFNKEGPIFENRLNDTGRFLGKPYMEIGDINAVISMVESNLGVTIISREVLKESVKKGLTKIVPIDGFSIMREFNFVYLDISKLF